MSARPLLQTNIPEIEEKPLVFLVKLTEEPLTTLVTIVLMHVELQSMGELETAKRRLSRRATTACSMGESLEIEPLRLLRHTPRRAPCRWTS